MLISFLVLNVKMNVRYKYLFIPDIWKMSGGNLVICDAHIQKKSNKEEKINYTHIRVDSIMDCVKWNYAHARTFFTHQLLLLIK